MNVMVTGGAGFIGSQLVEALLGRGDKVVVIDNFDPFYDPSIKYENIRNAQANDNYLLVEGDIRSSEDLDLCFKENDIDVVVHLAAKAGVRPSIEEPAEYFSVNIEGTVSLLEAMRKYDCKKLVFASSSSVYGNNKKVPFSEDDNVDHPISPYAATKKAGELLCHTYYHLFGFDIFCMRYFTVYGPGQRPEMAIAKFVRMILNGDEITLYGDGTSSRDYTYIADIIHGLLRSIDRVKGFEVLNLGESEVTTLIDLVRQIEKSLGIQAKIKYMPMQPGDVDTTFADISKAKRILDYNPQTKINKGVDLYVAWVRERIARLTAQG